MKKWLWVLLGLLLLGLAWLVWYLSLGYGWWNRETWEPGMTRSEKKTTNSEVLGEEKQVGYELVEVARNLFVPWGMVFTSPERMLVTERDGKIREIVDGKLEEEPVFVFEEVVSEEGAEEGLMSIELDPEYETNGAVYVCLAYEKGDGIVDKVERLIDGRGAMRRDRVILDDLPSAQFHAGCRIKFGPDGKLYVTLGDATQRQLAQSLDSLAGKILRINGDGSVPQDNPFDGSPIYSLGHRNPQGIAWHPATGVMVSTEHGPSGFDGPGGGDEINVIEAGGNYGWPLVSHERSQAGLISPIKTFTPAVAPSGAMFYHSRTIPQFENNFFFAALRGEGLFRVVLDEADQHLIRTIEQLDIKVGRVRDVIEGPDGQIYFATSNRDGRGTLREGDDKIYTIRKKG